ncbi:surface lipoprotein assembly modifier [Paraglaciecola aestuariivivens]
MKHLFNKITALLILASSAPITVMAESSLKFNGEAGAGVIANSALSVDELDDVSSQGDNGYEWFANLGAEWRTTKHTKLTANYTYNQQQYREFSEYDLALQQLSVDGSYLFSKSELGIRADAASAALAGDTFLDYQQVSVYLGYFIQPQTYLRSSLKTKQKHFAELSERDAKGVGASVDLFHFLNGANTMLMLGLSAEQEDAQDQQFTYNGLGLVTKVSHKFGLFGLDTKFALGLRLQQKDYQTTEHSSVLTEESTDRDETRRVIEASWQLTLLDNLALKTELEHGDFDSQLDSQTYQQTLGSLGLTYSF